MNKTIKFPKMDKIEYEGDIYWYEYKAAKHKIDTCLATKDPKEYCNGFYLYSDKDPGSGKAFVVTGTTNLNFWGEKDKNKRVIVPHDNNDL